ncbi:hypothetical protein TAL182_CH01125 [Rhizobium sp. TAL182]|uniref:hypothetical protein n=1 Tax=Rhizobium sp. TAL182 TaxID=2020313 RepID=UPI000A20F3E9|nr:hypothetical protein [Rhizobium sp. TAL182]ARO22938.1 hypothetical protein TAL182_CH01125 [Rhizobium sp. TAL182]
MTSLISSIRAAIRSGALPSDLEDVEIDPDASASNSQPPHTGATTTGGNMSENQTVAGAAGAAAAAIAAAATSTGGADGFKTAMDRISAVLGAEGIKGDGKRMAAALDLAVQSPDMAADAVVAFVTANVSAASTASVPTGGQQQAASYEQQRVAAAALAQPQAGAVPPAEQAKAGWGKISNKINSRIA